MSAPRHRRRDWLNKRGPLLALFAVYGLFAAIAPASFRTAGNLELMAIQTAGVGTAAIGMTLIIMSAGIDLSVGSMAALTSVVIAVMMRSEFPPLVAAIGGIAVATMCGRVNGLVITRLKVVPFIATLGTLLLVRGVALFLGDEQKVDAPRTWLRELLSYLPPERAWMLLAPGVWLLLLLAVLTALMLRYSKLGRHIQAIGSNEQTARLCGVAVERVKVYVYTIGGATAGLSGTMLFSRLNVGDPTSAVGMELDVIAAVVIGGGSLSGGEGSVLGSLVGAMIMTVIKSGCTQLGLPTYTQQMVTGAIIVIAVALDRLRHRAARG